jgi:hypothetical protein
MARVPVRIDELLTELPQEGIIFGEDNLDWICLQCGVHLDHLNREERCRRREDYVDWMGNPFRPEGTH